jgi:hypothetical protein
MNTNDLIAEFNWLEDLIRKRVRSDRRTMREGAESFDAPSAAIVASSKAKTLDQPDAVYEYNQGPYTSVTIIFADIATKADVRRINRISDRISETEP